MSIRAALLTKGSALIRPGRDGGCHLSRVLKHQLASGWALGVNQPCQSPLRVQTTRDGRLLRPRLSEYRQVAVPPRTLRRYEQEGPYL
jgi:hypothetical protein